MRINVKTFSDTKVWKVKLLQYYYKKLYVKMYWVDVIRSVWFLFCLEVF